jgi:hypothetical protein
VRASKAVCFLSSGALARFFYLHLPFACFFIHFLSTLPPVRLVSLIFLTLCSRLALFLLSPPFPSISQFPLFFSSLYSDASNIQHSFIHTLSSVIFCESYALSQAALLCVRPAETRVLLPPFIQFFTPEK